MGYEREEMGVEKGKSCYEVSLWEDSERVDEVVVVGLGREKKVKVRGGVGRVERKGLE